MKEKLIENIVADLKIYGINEVKNIYYNLNYDELYEHEINPKLEGYEKGFVTNMGAVAVDTGIFTGRSPKDKYIVVDEESKGNVWWAAPDKNKSDNKPISKEVWNDLLNTSACQLTNKNLYVMDAFCGANENTRIKIRVVTEVAWMAHFVKNMFIRPTDDELVNFKPDFVLLNACKTVNPDWERHNLNSDVYIAFNIKDRMAVIGGTWYGGEIKKGFFSIMNYFLPLQGIASMHCSANMGRNGDTAIFFGLSGTGKTTLSADPERYLIGDDEHGWDDEGIFNFEGGCYAKCINLSEEKEPDIFKAIRRNALLENVVYNEKTGAIDFNDSSKTENTRVSYPIYHIDNIVKPVSKGAHPKKIIFLTADAFGVFPPVSKLSKDQTMYYFLSGYTAKLAGTERGVKEPMPTFSSAFGAAFLMLHPTVYAKELARKMEEFGATAYMVNTGWIGGPYGVGKRIDIQSTRNIIKAILDGTLDNAEYIELPTFGFQVPTSVPGVESAILNPRKYWKYETAYVKQASELAEKFIANFQTFTDTEEGKRLVAAGPKNPYMKQFYEYYQNKINEQAVLHKEEIARLKDQIFILQESFGEYISFNSIDSEYKSRSINRYIPVVFSISDSEGKLIKEFDKKIEAIVAAGGFDFYSSEDKSHAFHKYLGFSKKRITLKQQYSLMETIGLAFTNNKGNSELEKMVQKFIDETANYSQIILKVGSVLIIKNPDTESSEKFLASNLSIASMIHIDKHPEILTETSRIYKELNVF